MLDPSLRNDIAPLGHVQVDVRPHRLTELAWSNEDQGCKAKSAPDRQRAFISIQCSQHLSDLTRLRDSSEMLTLHRTQSPSQIGTWLYTYFAARKELLDTPNHRSSHINPTPTGGGLVIYIAASALLAGATYLEILPTNQGLAFLLGGSVVAITGFIDDHFILAKRFRIGAQLRPRPYLFCNSALNSRMAVAIGIATPKP